LPSNVSSIALKKFTGHHSNYRKSFTRRSSSTEPNGSKSERPRPRWFMD
jgi:hypothetical protein